ncbi:MAG: phytoene desaturase [Verrucomicrobia bacterium]|nr:phytoene desaturase [Verrucomicrobiota bacterium]
MVRTGKARSSDPQTAKRFFLLPHPPLETAAEMKSRMAGKRAIVVGGGIGGLATALRLRKAGAQVVLLEKNGTVGGKVAERRAAGFRWDLGPSLFTMPQILDRLFSDLGEKREEYLTLEPLSPTCRYRWADGYQFDENEFFWSRPDSARLLRHAEGLYNLSAPAFLESAPSEILGKILNPRLLPLLRHLPAMSPFQSLASASRRFYKDPHLQQFLQRFATYNGSDPELTPATFAVIPYVQARYGGWFIRGGIRRLAEALLTLAQKHGVAIRTKAEVATIEPHRVTLENGYHFPADLIFHNGDVLRAYQQTILHPGARAMAEKIAKPQRAISGFVVLLGVKGKDSSLGHHNIFFSDNYPLEFRQLFREKIPAENPTIYLCLSSRSQPGDAPADHDNYFLLVNAPAEAEGIDWAEESPAYTDRIIRILDEKFLPGLSKRVVHKEWFSPGDFETRDAVVGGSLYGWASHGMVSSFLRPPIRSPLLKNLYFVGGTTHPGGGLPLVLLSAEIAVRLASKN